ncbi:MAG: chemotaxis protein, partial [Sulfurimonas sp.]|nr:chemotaxis protein [Sulfurimonas sp.]
MNNILKNTIISIAFLLLIGSLFLTDSNIMQASLAVVAFVVVILLNLQKNGTETKALNQKRLELIEMMEFKRNKVRVNENATDEAEKNFNKIATTYQNSVLEDTRVAGEMVLLTDKVAKGHYSCRIGSDSKTPYVHVLRNSLNNMLGSSERNLDNAIATLQKFSEGSFS